MRVTGDEKFVLKMVLFLFVMPVMLREFSQDISYIGSLYTTVITSSSLRKYEKLPMTRHGNFSGHCEIQF